MVISVRPAERPVLPKVKIEFNHDSLRKAMQRARKMMKLTIKYAAEASGIEERRYSNLEKGYKADRPELQCKFTVHEVLSICLAFDLDIWAFTIMPVQMSYIEGSANERRDRAWAEAQSAWQQNAELRELLRLVLNGKFGPMEKKRATDLCKTVPAGSVGVG